MNLIACVDKNWAIGYNGDLLIRIPEDLKLFKKLTFDKHVIMGRKTMESLPKKYLENRVNIVLSHKDIDNPNVIVMKSVDELLEYKRNHKNQFSDDDYWVIGGAEIYKLLLDYCDTAFITAVNHSFENADAFIPNLYDIGFINRNMSGLNTTDKGYTYRFNILERVK